MAKEKNKSTIITNTIKAILVLILIVGLGLYYKEWKRVKNEEKYLNSYLIETKTVNLQLNSLKEYSQIKEDMPSEYFILISYTKDKNVNKLETKLKTIIDGYSLQNIFYYLNATDLLTEDYYKELNKVFGTEDIKKAPALIYVKDYKLEKVISSNNDKLFNVNDFEKLLKDNEYEKAE
jgi:hypothetical protein